jgi:hypothetical protein
MKIIAFDIGKKNFAFVMEEVDDEKLKTIVNIPKKERYNKDGTCTDEFNTLLQQVYLTGKILMVENMDLTYECDKKKYLDPRIYLNMITEMDKYKKQFDECDVFLIERQMSFGKKKTNTMALKLGQHCYSYLLMKYLNNKIIIDYPAYYKTQILGAPKKFGKIPKTYKNGKTVQIQDNRKKWSVRISNDILQLRNDKKSLEIINDTKKRDDMCDCLLMTITFSYLYFINKTKFSY